MIRIRLAPAPAQRQASQILSSTKALWDEYFIRSPIQGTGELMIYGIDTHKLMVAVPVGRFTKEYARVQPSTAHADASHVILEFRAR
jgi:hypothetical protein